MRYSFLWTAGTLVSGTTASWIAPSARNFIYVMPDGKCPFRRVRTVSMPEMVPYGK